jgi:putative ABC transport system permease protein
MKTSIKNSFNELGSDVIYVDSNPWGEEDDDEWKKYMKFKEPDYDDYLGLKERLTKAKYVSYCCFTTGSSLRYNDSSLDGAFTMGPTYNFVNVNNIEFKAGRWFTNNEYHLGANKIVIGNTLATELFQNIDPIGKYIKYFGERYQVIGVITEQGDNLFSPIPYDIASIIPLPKLRQFINIKDERNGRIVSAKAKSNVSLDELKDETIASMRSIRSLRPKEENDFYVNNISMLDGIINDVFGVMTIVGLIIGIFALIVGLFSVANIMFVVVKERTSIIGVKKALGAKRNVILLEILTEAVILCIVGGAMGIFLVMGILHLISSFTDFPIGLTLFNAMYGVLISVFTGILAGLLPAISASKLDPVVAIRS